MGAGFRGGSDDKLLSLQKQLQNLKKEAEGQSGEAIQELREEIDAIRRTVSEMQQQLAGDLSAIDGRLDGHDAAIAAQPTIRSITRNVTTDQYGQARVPSDVLGSGDILLAVYSEDYRYVAVKQQGLTVRVYTSGSAPSWATNVTLSIRIVYADYN